LRASVEHKLISDGRGNGWSTMSSILSVYSAPAKSSPRVRDHNEFVIFPPGRLTPLESRLSNRLITLPSLSRLMRETADRISHSLGVALTLIPGWASHGKSLEEQKWLRRWEIFHLALWASQLCGRIDSRLEPKTFPSQRLGV
jgi:hypothetical protein